MKRRQSALAIFALAASLAGCSAWQPPLGAPTLTRVTARAAARPDKSPSYLYVANFETSKYPIDIFLRDDPSKGVVGHISKILAPDGIFVDSHGILYATTSWLSGNNSVWAYKPGASKPFRIYTGAICAFDVTVGDDGTVYIADACGKGDFSKGRVLVYPPGATKPSHEIHPGGSPYCLALDAANNLYVGYLARRTYVGQVKRYRPGSHYGVDMLPANTVYWITGIAVDDRGALLVATESGGAIDVFTAKGKPPTRVIKTGQAAPFMFAFDKQEDIIYVSDPCLSGGDRVRHLSSSGCSGKGRPNTVVAIDYATGKRLWTLHENWAPMGVAVSPSAP